MLYRVQLLETSECFDVAPDETILGAAQRANVALAHQCQFGACGTCRIKVMQGEVAYAEPPAALSDEEAADGYALACQALPRSDVVVSAARPLAPCSDPQTVTARLESIRPLTPDVLHVALELPADLELVYRPGQYVNLLTDGGVRRSFSLASKPDGRRIDFQIRRIPGGRFTDQRLAQMAPGEAIDVELPLGSFCFHPEDYRPVVLAATGTGLAPIKSIVESLMGDPDCPPVALYWGVRTEADLYLHDEIRRWHEQFDDFTYVPVLSRVDATWRGRRGHVQQAVLEDLPDLSEHAIYLCGSPNMIADAKRAFCASGASAAHLYVDSFNFQP